MLFDIFLRPVENFDILVKDYAEGLRSYSSKLDFNRYVTSFTLRMGI